MKRPDPITWAKDFVAANGWDLALKVATTTGRQRIGNSNDSLNPHNDFYRKAEHWLLKNVPIKDE